MMKRKVLIFTFILVLLVSFAPTSANAANNKMVNQKLIERRQKFKVTKPTKAQIKAVGSELEYYKQIALEDVNNLYIKSNRGKYSKSIKNLIDDYYNELSNRINNIENQDELIGGIYYFFGMPIILYAEDISDSLYTFETLVLLDIDKINGMTFNEFKELMLNTIDYNFSCYTSEWYKYNNYYYSIIEGDNHKYRATIDSATDWLSLAEALGHVRAASGDYLAFDDFSVYLSLDYECDNYDYDDDYDYDYDEDEDNLAKKLGINTPPVVYIQQRIYTNSELFDAQDAFAIYLKNYAEQLIRYPDELNPVADEVIDDIYEQSYDIAYEIDSLDSFDEMLSLYDRTIDNFIKETGVEYKQYSQARYTRLLKKIETLKEQYTDPKVYTENTIDSNNYIFDSVVDLISPDYILFDVELPEDDVLLERLKGELKKTTIEEKLKKDKKSTISYLKAYKNNKKYNQTKVVPIVDKGISKINNAKTIEEVWDIYYEYKAKAKKTIYKFKITTSKVGKGTISKSKTVDYGSKYAVKIKPNVGYKISAIYVDGKKVKLTETYTFKNVTKKHTIKVIFE